MKIDLNKLHNLAEAARARAQTTEQRRTGARSWYRIENKAGDGDAPASVYVYDTIGEWGVSAQDFVNELRGITAKTLDLHVNCEGGEVFDGLAMFESLVKHPATITAYVEGLAASAASFLVMAADKIIMAPRARMMIHDAHGFAMGNARDMTAMAALLEDLSENIADIYAERVPGTTRADWRKAMQASSGGPDGTWYDATAAVKAGLADEVRTAGGKTAAAALPTPESIAAEMSTWDAAAFLGMVREVDEPQPAPAEIPYGSALLSLADLA